MATSEIDGYRIDAGFQLLNPAYPQVPRALDLGRLDLRPFDAGFVVAGDGPDLVVDDPLRRPSRALAGLHALPGSLWSLVRLGVLLGRLRFGEAEWLRSGPDTAAASWLRARGVDGAVVEGVLRPFLAGVLLDAELESSGRLVGLLLRAFLRGVPAVPARGMGAVPAQMAADLAPGVLRFGSPVIAVAAREVVLEDGARLEADDVIVAVDGPAAARLVGRPAVPCRGVTTYWLAGDEPSVHGRRLVADRRGSDLVNSVDMTAAAPAYAPPGRRLFAASSLVRPGPGSDAAVVARVAASHRVAPSGLEVVAVSDIPQALPRCAPPLDLCPRVDLDGVLLAGDHVATPSIQGALASGERAARAALARGRV